MDTLQEWPTAADDSSRGDGIQRLELPLVFPAGLAPGAGRTAGNELALARDGRGRPLLRGSALAGALRSAWARAHDIVDTDTTGELDPRLAERFGAALDHGAERVECPSALRVRDVLLETGVEGPTRRAHNAVDRHTGAVRDGGLFSIEALPPGTRGTAVLEFHGSIAEGRAFLAELVGILRRGLVVGGHGARGIGRAELVGDARWKAYDLGDRDGLVGLIDDSWAERCGNSVEGAVPLEAAQASRDLVIDVRLAVPRGQDLCVGDDGALDHVIEPQRVRTANGAEHLRLPGSSLRGVLRSWYARLSARAGEPVADTVERFLERGGTGASGDDAGWGFADEAARAATQEALAEEPRALARHVPCPVMRLFGSLYAAGRIHVADALSEEPLSDDAPEVLQTRMHVAVDSVTGGANDGFLFSHQAVLAGVVFPVRILVRDAQAEEAERLAQCLRALDLGLLRVGSSKSAGRLALAGRPVAEGPHAEFFTSLEPSTALAR